MPVHVSVPNPRTVLPARTSILAPPPSVGGAAKGLPTSVAVAHVTALGPWCEQRAQLGAAIATGGIRWWGDVVALSGSPLPYATVGGSWEGSQAQPGWPLLSSETLVMFMWVRAHLGSVWTAPP